MKTKLWLLLTGVAFFLLTPRDVEATGACTSARFHDWQDLGSNQNNAGAGGVPKAKRPPCPGMPQWWVHEPYENLWMSDKPLSYTTSSGQEIAFEFYYRQRYKLPDSDEVSQGRKDPYATAREQITTGQARTIRQLAGLHGLSPRFIRMHMKLVQLGPQAIETMMRRPHSLPLSLTDLLVALPMNWSEQTSGVAS